MAAIDPASIGILHAVSGPHKFVVFGLKGVTTGDTVDLSTHFSKVQMASFFSTTALVKDLPSIAGAIMTIGTVGLLNDAGYLVVLGAPASF